MKANWKIALMCVATLAFVACKNDNPDDPEDPNGGGGKEPAGYVSPINVKDKSVADWDELDQTKVSVADMTAEPYYPGLKQLKVYSDGVYINYMLVIDPAIYSSHAGHPDGMHIYLDIDLSDETGGFFDSFADAAVDLMMEGPLFDESGVPVPYAPNLEQWVGPEGSAYLPSERDTNAKGSWEDSWSLINTIKGESQFIGEDIVEGRILVDYISTKFSPEGFGIGVDIQQGWETVGLLPQLDAAGENGEFIGRTNMLYVAFDKAE